MTAPFKRNKILHKVVNVINLVFHRHLTGNFPRLDGRPEIRPQRIRVVGHRGTARVGVGRKMQETSRCIFNQLTYGYPRH